MNDLIENSIYLLVLLNPVSKIFFLSTYNPPLTQKQVIELSWKSSAAALQILLLVTGFGNFLLSKIFHVQEFSLKIGGGLVIFLIGWTAVRQGKFAIQQADEIRQSLTDVSLVPLAAPLIAGPGMIAASISLSAQIGFISTAIGLIVSLTVNFLLMMLQPRINHFLMRLHLRGPIIRLSGLVIMVMAVQMILEGFRNFFATCSWMI